MSFKSNVFTLDYPKSANRVDLYDFMRGVAMIIVMIQHSGFPGGPYLVAFHMPLFFFLSGMVASRRPLPSFGVYIYGKFKRLMIPYFCFGLLALAINYIKLSLQGIPYDITKAALGVLTGQYGFVPPAQSGLYWFFFVMFMADLMVYPINKYLRNSMAAKVGGAILFFLLSYITTHYYPIPRFTIEKAFMGAAFILIGEICKPWIDVLTNRKARVKDAAITIITSLCVLLSVHFNYENVLMYLNQYGNYGWFILGSMSGIIMVIIISNFIYQTLSRNKRLLYQLVMWVGFNSLVVFPVHLLINSNLQVLYDMIGRGTAPIRLLMMFALGIPICNFITNYMPWMIGMAKKKTAK